MIILIRKRILKIATVCLIGAIVLAAFFLLQREETKATAVIGEQMILPNKMVLDTKDDLEKNEVPFSSEESSISKADETNDKLIQIKLNWQKQRQKQWDELCYLLEKTQNDATKREVEQKLLQLTQAQATEEQSEQILAAKNYHHVAVMVDKDMLTAVMQKGATVEDGVIVAETLARCTQIPKEHITVLLQEETGE